jgi:hypothetical protein
MLNHMRLLILQGRSALSGRLEYFQLPNEDPKKHSLVHNIKKSAKADHSLPLHF